MPVTLQTFDGQCLICAGLTASQAEQISLLAQTIINGGVTPMPVFPVTNGLLLQNESFDFDNTANGAAITQWNDRSGSGHHWNQALQMSVDQVRKCGTHPTLRFAGPAAVTGLPQNSLLAQTAFIPAGLFAGMEVVCGFKRDFDPPPGANNVQGGLFAFNRPIAFPHHHPFSDNNFYEGFGQNARSTIAAPAIDLSVGFHKYRIASLASGTFYNVVMDGTSMLLLGGGGYTYQQQGIEGANDNLYFLGMSEWYGNQNYILQGNMAFLYLWNRVLTAPERVSVDAYINSVYGI